MTGFFRRRPILAYLILAYGVCSLTIALQVALALSHPALLQLLPDYFKWLDVRRLYVNVVTIGLYGLQGHAAIFLIFLYAGAPTISAITVSWLAFGRQGLGRLFARLKPWGPGADRARALKAWLVLLIGHAVGIAVVLVVGQAIGKPDTLRHAFEHMGGSLLLFPLVALAGSFVDEGGMLEELGWRGFALPLLQEKLGSPLRATLLLALIWWSWHLPRDVPGLIAGENLVGYLEGQAVFFSLCLSLAILATTFVNLTGGSVLPAMFIHGATNLWSKGLLSVDVPPIAKVFDLRTLVVYAFAVLALLIMGPRLGLAPRAAAASASGD